MQFKDYLEEKNNIQQELLDYIDDESDSSYQQLIQKLDNSKIGENPKELTEFLHLLVVIANNHHRSPNFYTKIEKIIDHFDIEQTFSKSEIYQIFSKNRRILLYLIQKNILSIDDFLQHAKINEKHASFVVYFLPELNGHLDEKTDTFLKKEIKSQEIEIPPEESREKGENHSFLAELIRKDEIQEFIKYVNQLNINLNTDIKPSICESNEYLIGKETSLIEYAAFFGSIQVVQYLRMNNVELKSKLWDFAIHSNNAELIHLLEELKVEMNKSDCQRLIGESIKCHHNNVANYLIEKYKYEGDEKCSLQFFNFIFFPDDILTKKNIFFDFCRYDYPSTLEMYLKNNSFDINSKMISKKNSFF